MATSRRWFHPNISGQQAEHLLMEKGQEWSFLARPSSQEGAYTLSIRRNGEVTHIKIQNTGDSYDLYGGDKFASLSELVQHYMENQDQLKEKNGAIIKLKYPMASDDPTPERWFHGNLTGREAERLLLEKGKTASFLVRESQSKLGDFVISVRSGETVVTHVKIRFLGNQYDVGGGDKFNSLSDLVEHYKKIPMVETSGTVVYIKHPLYNSRMMASSLESRIKQLQLEDEESQQSSVASFHEGFWGEFHQLQQCEFTGIKYQREIGSKPVNKGKNRYKNILPYDYTRVHLNDGKEELGTDYINANLIMWTDDDIAIEQKRHYIATQAPLTGTMADFYRMIWQEKSRVIVNLARITERGKVQVNIYWPAQDSKEKVFVHEGPPDSQGKKEFICQYRVTLVNESSDNTFIRREMLLKKENKNGQKIEEPRKLYQFHYIVWPDYNVPDDPGSMIDFLELINNLLDSLPEPGPVIVHCSAGIGRTGTLIVTDMLIAQVKAMGFDCDIDIFKTILMVRAQRSGLVQTQSQYQFVYTAVQRYMEVERQRLHAVQTGGGREYTNIKYATGAVEAAKRGQAPPIPPLPKAAARRAEHRQASTEDHSQQYQNLGSL